MSKIPIKQLIAEYLNSKDEGSDRFRRLYRIATLQGVRKFNMDICGEFRTQLLSISANHTVPFPADYLDYSMIGIVNAQGEAVPLKHNENIIPVKQAFLAAQKAIVSTPSLPGSSTSFGTGFPYLWLNYWGGSDYLHLYGIGGGTPSVGEFTIDDAARCIRINPEFPYSAIIVEYLTNGYDSNCAQYTVHTFASIAFIAWLRWQDSIDQPKKASDSHVRYLKNEFNLEKMAAKARLNKARVTEMEAVRRSHVKLVARA